jgi:hypothetical protein
MLQKTTLFLIVLTTTNVIVFDATADSYRCGQRIVRDGDSVAQLLAICGEPRFKNSSSSKIKVDGVYKQARVQRWHYKKGSRSLERIVLIYRGKIAAIEVGGR